MMKTDVSNLYLKFLFDVIRDQNGWRVMTHKKLIEHLHHTLFIVANPNDQPRENDGIDLRWRFAWECGHMGDDLIYIPWFNEEHCTILEMMVALALRADENFTRKSNYETTVSWIFWSMVQNMGLLGETDNMYDYENVDFCLDRFNNRMYEPNGHGGLFMFPNTTEDIRNVEIWYQLCRWINEHSA